MAKQACESHPESTDILTPMMRQYRKVKQGLPSDTLLLFRMGDFYEMFFEDAQRGSQIFEIVLTKRQGVPMAGIPYHALQNYLPRALQAGIKIAIAEQMEDPKQAKGLVQREITQIITPGTIVEGTVLPTEKSNYLVSLCPLKNQLGLALFDVSTGEFRVCELENFHELEGEICRLRPSEIVLPSKTYELWEKEKPLAELGLPITWSPLDDWLFSYDVAHEELCQHFGVNSLHGFGCESMNAGICAAGAVLSYVRNNLKRNASHVTKIQPYSIKQQMVIDRISQRNLELVEPLFRDNRQATLLATLNQTMTPMGARLLREWILRPLISISSIEKRLDVVETFTQDHLLLEELRELLTHIRDVERILSRLNVGSGNARDLLALKKALEVFPLIKETLLIIQDKPLIQEIIHQIEGFPELVDLIQRAIVDDPPASTRDGGMIREGFHAQLDEYRSASSKGKDWIIELQQKEQQRTGISSLKVKYNKVFGYFIEVRKTHLEKIPENYIRKQTLTQAERFITPELKEIEDKVLGAEDKAKALEEAIFDEIRQQVIQHTSRIQQAANAIAILDVLCSFAYVAIRYHYARPKLVKEPILRIYDGRHPVVELLMQGEKFVPNDTELDGDHQFLMILTGPNMAGKSTYIRQVALITIMAHIGSFVPAREAIIGLTDRIFTRIGAADDLTRGQSTFMIEMLETANILNNATSRSLIILDEIGRGTSTYDGLSIAWSVAEYIHEEIRARTLFATHYHELTGLANLFPGICNANVAVREWGDKVIFLHKILPGSTDKSYGIHVARLAGLPLPVIERATEILSNLETTNLDSQNRPKIAVSRKKKRESGTRQPSLFDLLEQQRWENN